MKIDKRKNYYMVLDTEGLGLNDRKNKIYGKQKSYDIGYVIIDKKGNVQKEFNALTEEIFGDGELMSTAYFNSKIPLYEYMIDNKEIKVKTFKQIINQMKRDLKAFKVKGIFAYNTEYDIVALAETSQYALPNYPKLKYTKTKKGKWKPMFEKFLQSILETKVEFYDIWTMACATLCQQKLFLSDYAKFTKNGNIITNAEAVYNYIKDTTDFVEEHTALSDAYIESEILARIFANGCKPMKQMYFPFRLIPVQKKVV